MLSLKMVYRRNDVFLLLLFLVYPILTLPVLFRNIYYRKSSLSFTLLACFLGYIAILYPPTGDLYAYTYKYLIFEELSFDQFIEIYFLNGMDYILQLLLYGLASLNINCDISRFIYVTISYLLIFRLYTKILSINKILDVHKLNRFKCFLLLLLCFSFTIYTYRFYFSLILLATSIFDLFILNKKRGWLFLLLAILNHFSYIIYIPLLLLAKTGLLSFNKNVYIFIILSIFFLNTTSVGLLIQYLPLPESVITHAMYYLDGYFAGEYFEDQSLSLKIGLILRNLTLYPALLFFIIGYRYTKMTPVVQMMLCLLFIASPFLVVYYRFVACTIFLFLLSFIWGFDNSIMTRLKLRTILLTTFISFLCSIWFFRREFSISQEYKLLYSSSISILSSSFTEEWISKNVDESGAPINLK